MYYYVDNASMIPLITTRETQVVRGSSKVDAAFQPQIATPSPLLEGFAGNDLPPLKGYVVTTAKHDAAVALQSDRRDPVLAEWNYGLGRVVAWTSDLTTHWAGNWLSWAQFATFWAQTVTWSMEPPSDPELQISPTVDGTLVDFNVDVVNSQGAFQDLLDLRARVPGADGRVAEVPLTQTRTGRYEAKFSLENPGAYPLEVVQVNPPGQVVRDDPAGVVISYPAEYRDFGVNDRGLAALAAATGGRVLHDPAETFDRAGLGFTGQEPIPLWPVLLALAVFLFPLDVAIRRLRVDPRDLAGRGWANGRRRVAQGHAAAHAWGQRVGAWARRPLGATR